MIQHPIIDSALPNHGSAHPSAPHKEHPVLLFNRRAKNASDSIAHHCRRMLGDEYFMSTGSLNDAESACRQIVQSGYQTVLCGGGDGTMVRTFNIILNYVRESNRWREERRNRSGEILPNIAMPVFGFLPLGTGNSLQRVTGTQANQRGIRTLMDTAHQHTMQLPLLTDGDDHFYFGGFGFDSLLLQHYTSLKDQTQSTFIKPFVHSVLGYVLAGLGKTLPRMVLGYDYMPEVCVRTRNEAWYVDPRRGDFLVPIEAGTVLYEGRVGLVGAATSSLYGYGFKAFPLAGLSQNRFHLRIATFGAGRALGQLLPIWRGSYRCHHDMFDFLATDVDIELTKPFAYQHSGDSLGERSSLRWRMSQESIKLIDAYQPLFPSMT